MWLCLCFLLIPGPLGFGRERTDTVPQVSSVGDQNVLALAQWRVVGKEGHLLVRVSQRKTHGDNALLQRELVIYRDDGASVTQIFNFETPDALLNAYPLADYNARLFTTWVGGSAYHLRIGRLSTDG